MTDDRNDDWHDAPRRTPWDLAGLGLAPRLCAVMGYCAQTDAADRAAELVAGHHTLVIATSPSAGFDAGYGLRHTSEVTIDQLAVEVTGQIMSQPKLGRDGGQTWHAQIVTSYGRDWYAAAGWRYAAYQSEGWERSRTGPLLAVGYRDSLTDARFTWRLPVDQDPTDVTNSWAIELFARTIVRRGVTVVLELARWEARQRVDLSGEAAVLGVGWAW